MIIELEIQLTFSEFGWSALEERARSAEVGPERILELACDHYEAELAGGRAATVVPRLGEAPVERETRASRSLVLELNAACARRLEREAGRQGVSLERLYEHAALLYLADLDADRSAKGLRPADPRARARGGPTLWSQGVWA
jgi:hypothetical protein